MYSSRRLPVLIVTALASLALCSAAQAQVTIGQLAPFNPPAICGGTSADVHQASASTAPNPYVVPAAGLITSWSTNASPGIGQQLKLKVFRPVSGFTFSVLAHDGPRALTPSSLNTFAVSIPVQAGDQIGMNDVTGGGVSNACLFQTGSPGDVFGAALSDAPDGAQTSLTPAATGYRLNLSATLKLPPTIAGLAPASGSIKGGTAVTITGTEFGGTTAVSFGAAPAPYTVVSETQITAIAPAGSAPGAVPVSVKTSVGASAPTTAGQFTYTACVVPKLAGKKLKGAKKRIRKAGCKVGAVKKPKGVSAKTGVVVKQNPKAGKILAPGSKVNVKLG